MSNFELGSWSLTPAAKLRLSQDQLRQVLDKHPARCAFEGLRATSTHHFKDFVVIVVTELDQPRTVVDIVFTE